LILKNVVSGDEFDEFKDFIRYDFSTDNHFSELKEQEIFRERLDILSQAENYLGKFFSEKYIAKNVLRMTDDDIEKMAKEIEDEGGNEEDGDMDF
jgi:hypothetical protein